MSEDEKKSYTTHEQVFSEMTREEARDIFDRLWSRDMHTWNTLVENFPHPPSALIELMKKCEAKFPPNLTVPTEEEQINFLAGCIPYGSRRALEIAMFIINTPDALKKFDELSKPLVDSLEKQKIEGIGLLVRAKAHNVN